MYSSSYAVSATKSNTKKAHTPQVHYTTEHKSPKQVLTKQVEVVGGAMSLVDQTTQNTIHIHTSLVCLSISINDLIHLFIFFQHPPNTTLSTLISISHSLELTTIDTVNSQSQQILFSEEQAKSPIQPTICVPFELPSTALVFVHFQFSLHCKIMVNFGPEN